MTIAISRLLAILLLVSGAFGTHPPSASADDPTATKILYDEEDCLEAYPNAIAAPFVVTSNLGAERIPVKVGVAVQGFSGAQAHALIARAASAFSDEGIDLVVTSVRTFNPQIPADCSTSNCTNASFNALRQAFPPNDTSIDIAYGLVNRDSLAEGTYPGTVVVGQADCIGGLKHPTHRYAIGVGIERRGLVSRTTGLPVEPEFLPKVAAHEIGHLLGAHHHYGNCAEGAQPSDVPAEPASPCDLMFPIATNISFKFSTLNALTVRGHAEAAFG